MSWPPGAHGIPRFINFEQPAIIAGGDFTQQNHIDSRHYTFRSGEDAGYATLLENVAPNAMHDSKRVVDPPKCHPHTRVAILRSIIDWSKGIAGEEMNRKSFIWLNGGAGAGKSAIARSVAEQCSDQGLLLGSFFFATGDATRNHVDGLVATLCYQMCRILPGFRDIVSASIANDPLIFKSSISTQLITLLFDPFSRLILAGYPGASTTWIPRLIVIDGLDECSETMDQKNLLLALQEATKSTTLIRFLVCSRPEKHISSVFGLPQMSNIFFKIFVGDDYCASKDIRRYLEDKFKEIREGHLHKHTLPATWPAPKMVDDLVYKASGQFIYASTVIRYIESLDHKPHERLEVIFNLRPAYEDLPFAQLDALYRLIISRARNLPKVLDILAFPVLYGVFPVKAIEIMLQLNQDDVGVMLADLRSIVSVAVRYGYINGVVELRFLHKSVIDFLFDRQRAGKLYQDFSTARLQHIEYLIYIFSTEGYPEELNFYSEQPTVYPVNAVFDHDCVSSSILQLARQFPMFHFIKGFLSGSESDEHRVHSIFVHFLASYLKYLTKIKDVSKTANFVYEEQRSKSCESVLSVLENNFSDNWIAHFCYAFWYLLPAIPQMSSYKPRWGLLNIPFMAVGGHNDFLYAKHRGFTRSFSFRRFMKTMASFMSSGGYTIWRQSRSEGLIYWEGVYKISYMMTTGIRQKVIFAKAAAFCLDFLCDERSTTPNARRISRIIDIDRRKRREHPWRWRQLSPSRRSPHNRLVVLYYHGDWVEDDDLTRLGKAGRLLSRNRGCIDGWTQGAFNTATGIRTIREYFRILPQLDDQDPWINDPSGREREHYLSLLDFLPRILSLSGRYEPLVTMCRKKSFASLSLVWPKQARRARQAMERYLQRVDPQGSI
ncbi:hypothetical protein D9613_009749 [Agrocybe pediades]|uniref:Nephrocystin 3-like N-terminal domain-containing protein n=1 Tax=Agrocybe pediades TaxID=84607 RepID=A0A8H4QXH1_9AGAR|nr:hypothetical protein D9613_009749 [Agrocybe pediades]